MAPCSEAVRRAASVTPSARQLAWQALEFYGFVHFGINTFTGREWGNGSESPALFCPDRLDPGQWAEAAASAGMRGLILTCKHHDGFCLWPSRLTDHTVAASPWRGGKGDVVREAAEACRRAGLRFGVYLSPWDRHDPRYGTGRAYDEYYIGQLTELLTGYGELFCIWMDGACGEGANGKVQQYDWPAYFETVRRLQPGAVLSICGPDVRWCGNEAGQGRAAEWSVVPAALQAANYTAAHSQKAEGGGFSRSLGSQDADLGSRAVLEENAAQGGGLVWYPAEVDTSIRPGWFYHPGEDAAVRSPEELFGIYLGSVGANAALLLNLPPRPDGQLAPPDLASLKGLGALLRGRLGRDLAPQAAFAADSAAPGCPAEAARGGRQGCWQAAEGREAAELTLTFPEPVAARYLSLREELTVGQRIESGEVLLDGEKAAEFTVVGARRLCPLPDGARCRRITLRITASRLAPTLREIAVY